MTLATKDSGATITEPSFELPVPVREKGSLGPIEKRLVANFIFLTQPKTIIELGTLRGRTTTFMCEVLHLNQIDGKVFSFDLDNVVQDLRSDEENGLVQYETSGRLELVPGRLPGSLKAWLETNSRPVDFAVVDATHDYRSVMNELHLLWPRLSENGYLLCHDYTEQHQGVRYAVDRFSRQRNVLMLPLLHSPQGAEARCASTLVALAKRRYPFRTSEWVRHIASKARTDLMQHERIRHVWHKYLRAWVKRG